MYMVRYIEDRGRYTRIAGKCVYYMKPFSCPDDDASDQQETLVFNSTQHVSVHDEERLVTFMRAVCNCR